MSTLLAVGWMGTTGEAHGQALRVEQVVATKGGATNPFAYLNDLIMTEDGRVLAADIDAGVVHWWDPIGGHHGIFARNGDGPGEVRTPARFARRPEGGFALYDVGASAVFLYGPDAVETERIRIPGIVSNPKSLLVDDGGGVWISGGRLTDPRHIHVFDSTGTRTWAYGEPSPHLTSTYPRIQLAGGALALEPSGTVLFSYGAPLRIVRFRQGGSDSPEQVTEDTALLPELREEEVYRPFEEIPGAHVLSWWHDRSTSLFPLPGGCILNVVTRREAGDSVWDVYREDGVRLDRTVLPIPYQVHDNHAPGRFLASFPDPLTDESVAVVLSVGVSQGQRLAECFR